MVFSFIFDIPQKAEYSRAMNKSATELMQEIIFSAVADSISALKESAKGMPNILLRDLNAIHSNSTFADLPKEMQAAITTATRSAFNRLRKEGYSVAQDAPRISSPRRNGSPTRSPTRHGA